MPLHPLAPEPPRLFPFDCIALSEANEPITIGVLARNHTDALLTAQELFPEHTISLVQLSPEWYAPPQPSHQTPYPTPPYPLAPMKSPQLTRYWFQIESINQIQCIWAASFTEAKLKAAKRFLSHWGKITWLHLSD